MNHKIINQNVKNIIKNIFSNKAVGASLYSFIVSNNLIDKVSIGACNGFAYNCIKDLQLQDKFEYDINNNLNHFLTEFGGYGDCKITIDAQNLTYQLGKLISNEYVYVDLNYEPYTPYITIS